MSNLPSVGEQLEFKPGKMSTKDTNTFARIWKRYTDMVSARSQFEPEWSMCDDQVESIVVEDNMRKLNVNDPIEQIGIEIYMGKQMGKLNYMVEPGGSEANVDELTAAKYSLDHYIKEEGFVKEKRKWEQDKATYGTGILYTGIRMEMEKMYVELDKEIEPTTKDTSGFRDNESYEEILRTNWFMTPTNVPIRNFRVDDRAIYQPDFNKAEDCVMQETISVEALRLRYGEVKGFKYVDMVGVTANLYPAYQIENVINQQVILHYYYNKVTKEFAIMANREYLIYYGRMLYRRGKLPFRMAQHYAHNTRIYGIGIPRRLRYHKAYTNGMLQSIMDMARIGSGVNLGIGNNGQVDGELYTGAGEVNIRRFTDSIEQVKQFPLNGNFAQVQGALSLIKDHIRRALGDDPDAAFEPPAQQLGTVEIIEENKTIRQKTVEQLRDECLGEALQDCLDNISQFAASLGREEIKNEEGELIKVTRPKVKVENITVKKEKGKTVFEEDYGKYGFFDLKPQTVLGDLTVKIITPGMRTQLNVVEKNATKELVNNLGTLAQIYGPEVVSQIAPFEDVRQKTSLAYGYDYKLVAQTKKDKIKQEADDKIAQIQQRLGVQSLDVQEAANENPMTPGAQPPEVPETPEQTGGAEELGRGVQ